MSRHFFAVPPERSHACPTGVFFSSKPFDDAHYEERTGEVPVKSLILFDPNFLRTLVGSVIDADAINFTAGTFLRFGFVEAQDFMSERAHLTPDVNLPRISEPAANYCIEKLKELGSALNPPFNLDEILEAICEMWRTGRKVGSRTAVTVCD